MFRNAFTYQYECIGQKLFRITFYLLLRVNERCYGWPIRGEVRASGVRGFYNPGKLHRRLSYLCFLYGQHSRGLPGCFQRARDYKQQLATSTSGKGA